MATTDDHIADSEAWLNSATDNGTPPEQAIVYASAAQTHALLAQIATARELGDMQRQLIDTLAPPTGPAPVDAARDEYSNAVNLELRRSIAANVLEAMDVDQYLIDAVRNATPPEPAHILPTPTLAENKSFEEGFDNACDEIIRDLLKLRTEAITAPEQNQLDKAIAAVEHQKAWA